MISNICILDKINHFEHNPLKNIINFKKHSTQIKLLSIVAKKTKKIKNKKCQHGAKHWNKKVVGLLYVILKFGF